ncbi:hypothetical protein L596_016089 [Steinernema carpocapsae]|uniref:Uncharacterized protein n=1 Tax=Steinernema carpocapsae TaxID=34508 RepID=A0A4U5NHX6_STECR|nr:hypothetical protein L596_016089 [Steinernema carpocapsae]
MCLLQRWKCRKISAWVNSSPSPQTLLFALRTFGGEDTGDGSGEWRYLPREHVSVTCAVVARVRPIAAGKFRSLLRGAHVRSADLSGFGGKRTKGDMEKIEMLQYLYVVHQFKPHVCCGCIVQ